MRQTLTFILLICGNIAFGQKMNSDSLNLLLDKFVNVTFDDLEQIDGIEELENKYKIGLSSVGSCVNPFLGQFNDKEFQILKRRIQQLSERFYNNGTPLIITSGGMGDIENADRKNKIKNKYNVTFISLGGFCSPDENQKKLSQILTNRTLELLKIKSIDSISK